MGLVEKLGIVLAQESLNLLSNPEIRQQAQDIIQEVSGNVNRDTLEQAVEKACTSCTKKSVDDQLSVIAFVTALYMQNEINRAAQVGGTLRKRFGITWFPHIKERELRYALEVNDTKSGLTTPFMKRDNFIDMRSLTRLERWSKKRICTPT